MSSLGGSGCVLQGWAAVTFPVLHLTIVVLAFMARESLMCSHLAERVVLQFSARQCGRRLHT